MSIDSYQSATGDAAGSGASPGYPVAPGAPGTPAWPSRWVAALSGVTEVLAVVAHPDDESFGLGGLLAALAGSDRRVRVLCLTRGEASTLGPSDDLAAVRSAELSCAAERLGVTDAVLDDWPDGSLRSQHPEALAARVEAELGDAGAVVVLEPSGITGHPDHQTASRVAAEVAARHGLLVVEWGVPDPVAAALRDEFAVPISGLDPSDPGVVVIPVDRARQWTAISCHASQQPDNPVLARRLALSGDSEWVRLRPALFEATLARLVDRIGPLAAPDAGPAGRRQVLDRLVGFASSVPLPRELADGEPGEDYSVVCVHDDPAGWTLAAVRTRRGGCTPPHDHTSWGAAATAVGVERNRRYAGSCPDRLVQVDEQLAPPGGGYVFAENDIHQACDATGALTVSLHLLAAGGPRARQRCHEPPHHTTQ